MKVFNAIILYICTGCVCFPTKVDQVPFNSFHARQALADYIDVHPDIFVSPGRSESASEIIKCQVDCQTSGEINIGKFVVDLDNKTYQLSHIYGKPGFGWFEMWMWDGSFSDISDGKWKVDPPAFEKRWGK